MPPDDHEPRGRITCPDALHLVEDPTDQPGLFALFAGRLHIEALGLLWRLRTAGPDATVQEESGAERRALYIVAATFFLLAAYITYEAGTALFGREAPDRSAVGLVLSVLSLVIMPALAWWKQRTGHQMGSRALVADAAET
jgi:hypothetical protein